MNASAFKRCRLMEYRGFEYGVVRSIQRGKSKWIVSIDGVGTKTGIEVSKATATAAAQGYGLALREEKTLCHERQVGGYSRYLAGPMMVLPGQDYRSAADVNAPKPPTIWGCYTPHLIAGTVVSRVNGGRVEQSRAPASAVEAPVVTAVEPTSVEPMAPVEAASMKVPAACGRSS